jgi:hypothetical protein
LKKPALGGRFFLVSIYGISANIERKQGCT